jgi:hypothetical protein
MKNFENKIKTLTEHHDSLRDEEVVRLGKKDPEAYPLYIDKFIHIHVDCHGVLLRSLSCSQSSSFIHLLEITINLVKIHETIVHPWTLHHGTENLDHGHFFHVFSLFI